MLDAGLRAGPDRARDRHRQPAAAAARPRRHGDRPRRPPAAAARRRAAVRDRHRRHEGRRRAGARASPARWRAPPESFAELAVLLGDRRGVAGGAVRPRAERSPATTPACASRPASGRPSGDEGVVVRRKARRDAAGARRPAARRTRAAPPTRAATRCWRWPATAPAVAGCTTRRRRPAERRADRDPRRATRSTSCPAAGELIFDLRARSARRRSTRCWRRSRRELDGVALEARMERVWPGMDSEPRRPRSCSTPPRERLGRPIVGVPRGGASDASHFAATIPLTVDGLGPRGGGAHTPEEFVLAASLRRAGRGRAGGRVGRRWPRCHPCGR